MVNQLSRKTENNLAKENNSFDILDSQLKIFAHEYNMFTSEIIEDIEKIDQTMTKFENEYRLLPKEPEKPYSYLKFTGKIYDELAYSATLAYFLDPIKPHGFNRSILDAFLSVVGEKTGKNFEYNYIDIYSEYRLPNNRKADIIINGESWIIIIENKIWSPEGVNQTKDLYNGMLVDEMFAKINNENKYFVFLTPDGKLASDSHFIRLTYDELRKQLEKQGMNLLSETPVASVIHLTDFLRTIMEEFMLDEKKKEIFGKKSLLYLKYRDSIEDTRGTFYKDLKSFGESLLKLLKLNENEWNADMSSKYGWFAFFKKKWDRESLYIHFEIWTNNDTNSLDVFPIGPVAFIIHVEGQKKEKFFSLFSKNRQKIIKEYKEKQIQYDVRHGSHAKVIAYKEYPIDEDINKIKDIIIRAFSEFQFLIKYIDNTLAKIR